MRIQTLELIHYSADIHYTLAQFHAHCLFYHRDKRMPVHHSRKIVKPICQSQRLRICVAFAHFLYTAMYISAMWIHLTYNLSVKNGLQTKHTMCCRMLRTDVDYIVVICKQLMVCLLYLAVFIDIVFYGIICLRVVFKRICIVFRTHVIILTERIAFKV